MPTRQALVETLRDAQRLGFFGHGDVEDFVAHSDQYVDAVADVGDGARLVDLGSGGGLPGLLVAQARPGLSVTLVDRRQKRTDFLRRAVIRLGLHNAEVRCQDVDDLVNDVQRQHLDPYDVVTARGFGPPDYFLSTAVGLLADGGRAIISEPPSGDRWPKSLVERHGLSSMVLQSDDRFDGGVRLFQQIPAIDP